MVNRVLSLVAVLFFADLSHLLLLMVPMKFMEKRSAEYYL